MRGRAAPVVAIAALALGCPGSPGSARLEGRWIGIRSEGTSAGTAAAANAFATSTELAFAQDRLTVTTSKTTQYGRYRVVDEDASRVVITTDRDGPDQPQTFVFANDGTMRWAPFEGKSIVFARE
jgi:hypothetical protein